MPSEYSTSGGGALKLKGAKDAGVDKKRKKKSKQPSTTSEAPVPPSSATELSRVLAEEDAEIQRPDSETFDALEAKPKDSRVDDETTKSGGVPKTAAEVRYEEMRRKRLDERLKREGLKTHKERVEELNKYLSKLSEHHDMPRIGPG